MKLFNANGKLSKTVVVGLLEIVASGLLAGATWAEAGDFSAASIMAFVAGLVTIVLRHYTDTPLV